MLVCFDFFFFKQKTAYEMRISDWSSDVCSSDLGELDEGQPVRREIAGQGEAGLAQALQCAGLRRLAPQKVRQHLTRLAVRCAGGEEGDQRLCLAQRQSRSEEHTSELQSLMRNSYAVFCLKKKRTNRKIVTSVTRHCLTHYSRRQRKQP